VIRLAVALLVAMQALVPPGVCPCTLVPGASAPVPAPAPVPETPDTITAKHPHCPCEACRETARLLDTTNIDDRDKGDPGSDDDHQPPACTMLSAGAGARAAVLPARDLIALNLPPIALIFTEPAAPARADALPTPCDAAGPPLFVRHCAYLI
jgi:hypothetical protein